MIEIRVVGAVHHMFFVSLSMVVEHSVFEITTFKIEKPLFLWLFVKIAVLLTFWGYNPMIDS